MKGKLCCILLCFITLYSCKKAEVPSKRASLPYGLNNVHDYYVTTGSVNTFHVMLSLSDAAGASEVFTITPQGLPAGVNVSPAVKEIYSADSFRFSFSTNISVPGTYPITLKCTSEHRTAQSFTFNIIAQADCASSLTGVWNNYDSGTVAFFPSHYTAYVSIPGPNQLDIELTNRTLHCKLNCSSGTLTSDPFSSVYSGSSGTGTHNINRIVVRYLIYNGTNPITCYSILTR